MIYETIRLNDDIPDVTLTAYIPAPSSEYQMERKIPAVIVCPGGAFLFLSEREGEPVALRYNCEGYAAFVFRYHVGIDERTCMPQPLSDLGRAILYIRKNGERWGIDTQRISICGFSAGGHLATAYGSAWNQSWLSDQLDVTDASLLKPLAAVAGYPPADMALLEELTTDLMKNANLAMFGTADPTESMIKAFSPVEMVHSDTVPMFLWHTVQDELVDVMGILHLAEKLAVHQVLFQLEIYPYGLHGLVLANEFTACGEDSIRPEAAGWFSDMITFLDSLS